MSIKTIHLPGITKPDIKRTMCGKLNRGRIPVTEVLSEATCGSCKRAHASRERIRRETMQQVAS